jgi:hypothetical protein
MRDWFVAGDAMASWASCLALLVASWQPVGVSRLSLFFGSSQWLLCDSLLWVRADVVVHLCAYVVICVLLSVYAAFGF